MERDRCLSDRDWCAWLEFVCACFVEDLPTSFTVALLHLWCCWFGLVRNEILQSLKSHRSRAGIPSMRLTCIARDYLSLRRTVWNWSLFLAHPTYLARTCDFRKYTEFLLMLTSSLQSFLQNHSCAVCFPRACIHMCDECKRSNAPNVWHMLLSISLPHEQDCSQTIKYHVYQYEPKKDISEQFVSQLWTILPLIHFLLLWIDDHPCMALRLCTIAQLFYSQVRNIFPRISLHDHEDIVSAWVFSVAFVSDNFSVAPAEILDRTYFWNYPQYPCWSDILFECNPKKHGRGMMLVLPNQRLYKVFTKSGLMFCFFPASLISSTYTDKNCLFSRLTKNIPNLDFFPTVF